MTRAAWFAVGSGLIVGGIVALAVVVLEFAREWGRL